MDQIIVIRGFEILSFSLFIAGAYWVYRQQNPLYIGVYLASCFAGVYFDWINNLNWFLRVQFDERFIPLYYLADYPQPLAMSTTYAFYFGIPILLLVHYREALIARVGNRLQYPTVAFLGMIALPVFEIPMVQAFGLWTYYQKDAFLLGGVAWTNWIYSALLFLFIYTAITYAQDNILKKPAPARQQIAIGFAALVTAFAVTQFLQMMIYVVTDPWIASPRPF